MGETDMKRIIDFVPGYDKRDPDPKKNYGIGSMMIWFVLKGERGAVHFSITTGWYPENVQREFYARKKVLDIVNPVGADVGYHSPEPMYEGQETVDDSCEYLDGKPCYYDGSGLAADDLAKRFLVDGDSTVWSELENVYIQRFGVLE